MNCDVCNQPMHQVNAEHGTHPGCDLAEMNAIHLDREMSSALRHLDTERFENLAKEADRRRCDQAKRLESDTALLNAALWYVGHGLAVFPCHVAGKAPLTPHGLKDANIDPEQVRRWWARWPQANIGLPTGGQYDVIDIDGPEGYRSLATLKGDLRFPGTYLGRVITPSGGMHYYIPVSGAGNAAKWRPGIDYRGAGGYVVAPPSRREDGRRWEWTNPLHTDGYRTVYEWEAGW